MTPARKQGEGDDMQARVNTDKELWREKEGDFYSPSIHVTKGGGIGINVGGSVYVRPVREWHSLLAHAELLERAVEVIKYFREADCDGAHEIPRNTDVHGFQMAHDFLDAYANLPKMGEGEKM